jgi:hypothetical protein
MPDHQPPPEAWVTALGLAAVIALGLAAGAMLAEGGVLVPMWRSMPPETFLRWYADNAARLVDFYGPLEIASTLLTAAVAAVYWRRRRSGAGWLALATALSFVVLATFLVYFQDVNASFAAGTIPLERVAAELGRWAAWHWARTLIGIAAFTAAIVGARR